MRRTRKMLANLLLLLCVKVSCGASVNPLWTREADEIVNKLKECVQFPGLSVAIVKADDFVVKNYGVLDVESQREVNDNTRFCLGSLTKGFTAGLLTQLLHENGTYGLDSPVRDILGDDFELVTADLTANVTIRDILAHRVGIAKHFGAFMLGYNFTRAQILRRIRYLPQVKLFRSSRVFNNFLYVVAGALVEKLARNGTGKASWWENQVVERILKPLNMAKTTFADKVADWAGDFALPHALQRGKLVSLRPKITGNILRPVGPAGSICTTATDMSKWLKVLLNVNKGILNDSVIRDVFQVSNKFRDAQDRNLPVDSQTEGYGLGWIVSKYRGSRRIFHSGFSNYYYSAVSVLPEEGVAIYTAVNGPHLIRCNNGIKALHYYLTDFLLNVKPWLNTSNICSFPRFLLKRKSSADTLSTTITAADPELELVSTTEADEIGSRSPRKRKLRRRLRARDAVQTQNDIFKYEGSYSHPFFGPILISLNKTNNKLQLNYGYYGKALLESIDRQIFRMTYFGSLWYQSESDDMKLYTAKNMFNIQFASFNRTGKYPQKLVVFLFDTESPPVFTRITTN